MDRITVMIGISILLSVLILPLASANPVPYLNWWDAQSGGSPEPNPQNNNVTFFKEIVKADMGDYRVKVHADYWFRNERNQNETIKILLPLSKDPRGIDLKAEDIKTGLYQSLNFFNGDTEILGYQSIAFEISLTNFESVKVSVEFWDDLYRYDRSDSDHVNYYYAYLVGSARAWNRQIENASFEYRVPISNFDRGQWDGWNRTMNGSDYVFTKEYSEWLPDFDHDHESLTWQTDRPLPTQPFAGDPNLMFGTILIIIVIASIVLILVAATAMIRYIYCKKKEKRNFNDRSIVRIKGGGT
jgi:hypothetical protein